MAASHSRLVMAETVRSGPDDAKSSGWGQPGGVGALRAPAFRGVQRDPRTTEPFQIRSKRARREHFRFLSEQRELGEGDGDRKSTRLNSSHVKSPYAVFCLETKSRDKSRNV